MLTLLDLLCLSFFVIFLQVFTRLLYLSDAIAFLSIAHRCDGDEVLSYMWWDRFYRWSYTDAFSTAFYCRFLMLVAFRNDLDGKKFTGYQVLLLLNQCFFSDRMSVLIWSIHTLWVVTWCFTTVSNLIMSLLLWWQLSSLHNMTAAWDVSSSLMFIIRTETMCSYLQSDYNV